jgi:hypothetical protein
MRRLQIRVFTPGNDESELFTHRAPRGLAFTQAGRDQIFSTVWRDLEAWWPEYDYKLVHIGGHCFNFVCMGERGAANNSELLRQLAEPAHA